MSSSEGSISIGRHSQGQARTETIVRPSTEERIPRTIVSTSGSSGIDNFHSLKSELIDDKNHRVLRELLFHPDFGQKIAKAAKVKFVLRSLGENFVSSAFYFFRA
jgi:hypothetical protein